MAVFWGIEKEKELKKIEEERILGILFHFQTYFIFKPAGLKMK